MAPKTVARRVRRAKADAPDTRSAGAVGKAGARGEETVLSNEYAFKSEASDGWTRPHPLYPVGTGGYDADFSRAGKTAGPPMEPGTPADALEQESFDMASDDKSPAPNTFPSQGIRIFTYPKIIFIWPTFLAAVVSAIIMAVSGNDTTDPHRARPVAETARAETPEAQVETPEAAPSETGTKTVETDAAGVPKKLKRRFSTPQNIAGMLFLTVFFLNLLVMSVDFPRFTIIALILGGAALSFLVLYLNVYFELLPGVVLVLESVYAVANTWFYAMIATLILLNFVIIWATRYLDYWVIMPNEILHNHGPFSDLERFPTFNLKFDKEIPDILEYMLLGAGRLILHVANERRAIVLDNVLWIDSKEIELKKVMSRLDVRVMTDQEAVEPM